MFNKIYTYLLNFIDNNSVLNKINIWAFSNIKYFKCKSLTYIVYFYIVYSSLKKNQIKIYKNVFDFSSPVFVILKILILIMIILIFFFS